MSRHNKWSKIKNKKGAADAKRGTLFTKLCKTITIAAREGGGDPVMNFSLRIAIEKAKEVNVPKDNIDRAIKRGTGELKDGAEIVSMIYEGYGPGGIAILVEALTDNTNRTVSDLKHTFSSHGGSLGGPGSVQWQFERLGVVFISHDATEVIADRDQFELDCIEAGAGDIITSADGIEIRCPIAQFRSVLEQVQSLGIVPDASSLMWVPKETIPTSADDNEELAVLVDVVEEMDDVEAVYTNEA